MRLTKKTVPIAAVAVAALFLSACAEGTAGPGGSGSGAGVAFGASKEEYQAAFEDVDPIVIHAQSPNAKGSVSGRYIEKYHEAVEDWSGGKITLDTVYSSGVASPTDVDTALSDGRLDIGQIYPSYEPQEYPVNTALTEASVTSDFSVVQGLLSSNAWAMEVAGELPAAEREFEEKGMKLLVPYYIPGPTGMYCRDTRTSLGSLRGALVAAGGASQVAQLKALGASPVSLPFTEMYEGLQRGVADCANSSLNSAANSGIPTVAAKATLDPGYGIAPVTGAMAMSVDTWDSLPLVAQQLLHDRIDVFMTEYLDANWEIAAQVSRQLQEAGGQFVPFEQDARDTISAANADLVAEAGATEGVGDSAEFLARIDAANEEWTGVVSGLGYDNPIDYNGFGSWYEPGKIDTTNYVDKLMEVVYLPNRPA
ncbi:TRAP transporter substrate-binding protein DctP [Rhodococcus sp. NPDC057529]|uniref:TRAP transporter substrate-binding protein DctP n=1 Tax=Rhodococcus sp. NPDC057529 TaxID=3346158 RepID=UPI00366FE1A3